MGVSKGTMSGIGGLAGMGIGALLAAPTGGLSIPMGAMLGGSAGGMLGGLFGSDGGQQYEQGYDVVTLPQYSFTEPRLRLTSDYLSDNISRISRGEYPAYFDKALPTLRAGMMDPLRRTYYGQPGNRTGVVQDAMAMGAMTGLKGKAAMAPANKVAMDYTNKATAIDQYLTSLGVDIMKTAESTYLSGSMAMPKGPDAVVVNKMGGISGNSNAQTNELMGSLGQLAGNIDWGSLFGGGGDGYSAYSGVKNPNTTWNANYYTNTPLTYAPSSVTSTYAPPMSFNNPGYTPMNMSQYFYK